MRMVTPDESNTSASPGEQLPVSAKGARKHTQIVGRLIHQRFWCDGYSKCVSADVRIGNVCGVADSVFKITRDGNYGESGCRRDRASKQEWVSR
jgi:hypothetical protein